MASITKEGKGRGKGCFVRGLRGGGGVFAAVHDNVFVCLVNLDANQGSRGRDVGLQLPPNKDGDVLCRAANNPNGRTV